MPTAEGNRDEMVRLAEFFRQHPDSLSLGASEIAARANASETLVRSALASGVREKRASRAEPKTRSSRFSLSLSLDWLFSRPIAFVAITFAIAVAIAYLMPDSPKPSPASMMIRINEAIEIGTYVLMFLLHMACYAWRGQSRYALYGAAVIGGVGAPLSVITTYLNNPIPTSSLMPIFMGAVVVMISVLYAVLGVGFASVGAYIRIRREERTLQSRSRQDLLQRLFEIEEALRLPLAEAQKVRFSWPWLEKLRSKIFLVALASGFLVYIGLSSSTLVFPGPTVAQMRSADQADRTLSRAEAAKVRAKTFEAVSPGFFVVQFVFAGATIILQLGIAFLGGRPGRAVLVSLTFALGSTLGALIPIGTLGYEWMVSQWEASLIGGAVMAVILGLFAGIGASVEERAFQSRRRTANDPAVLLAEFVDIQRSLNAGGQSQCVLVVDAAKSSRMKANSDALTAEWSFRAYQQFLADIVRDCNGRVHSTAGDGAMAAFDRADQAFLAARTIQTKIADFNAYVNRLKDPFRLRIGIHCGEVSGELDEVEFTAVLDVAAHVEAASQVGGIAATAPVVEQLSEHRFAAVTESVDGYPVFLAMNPTLDPEADV